MEKVQGRKAEVSQGRTSLSGKIESRIQESKLMGQNKTIECEKVGFSGTNRVEPWTGGQNDVLIPGLPNEVALLCIARVPRSYHRNISGVSQSWRSLLHGQVLSKLRQELSLAEEWLYLWTATGNVWHCFDPFSETWSRLPPMPNDNRIPGYSTSFGSLDGKVFVIGGTILSPDSTDERHVPCKTVTCLDVRCYCWKRVADLNIARKHCSVGIVNNQLYVFGGFTQESGMYTTTAEVYDSITDTWTFVSSMESPMSLYDGVAMGDKFYIMGSEPEAEDDELVGVVYDTQTNKWEDMADGLSAGWQPHKAVLNGKFYTVGEYYVAGHLEYGYEPRIDEMIQVYNPSDDVWEPVEEYWCKGASMFTMELVELVTFCGKLCVISVETLDLEEGKYPQIVMVTLGVNESTKGPTCTATIQEFDEPFVEGLYEKFAAKSVQIIAL